MVNTGVRNINAILKADLDLSGYPCIGTNEYPYSGVFDGENHTVSLAINEDNEKYVGFFGTVTGNTCIKNLVVDGTVTSENNAGGIVGAVLGKDELTIVSIENCVNKAEVITKDYETGSIVGECQKDTVVNIRNCGNVGVVKFVSYWGEEPASLVGHISGEGKIANCYNTGIAPIVSEYSSLNEVEISNCFHATSDTPNESKKPTEAFISGEVTYLLNKGADQVIWYQTCGKDYPMPFGDADTQTVYQGYADCNADTLSYSNKALKQAKGHTISDDTFTYENKVITATCSDCKETATATLIFSDEEYGASIVYSTEWKNMNIPELTVKYATTEDGEYQMDKPSSKGTWYIKCFLNGTDDIKIVDSYEFKNKKQLTVENGIYEGSEDGRYEEGAEVTIHADLPDEGKVFKNWSVVTGPDISFGDATNPVVTFTMPDEAITVRANYEDITYKVSFDSADGTGTMEPQTIVYGQKLTLPANGFTAPNGMKFKYWAIGSIDSTIQLNTKDTYDVGEDITVYAVWEKIVNDSTPSTPTTVSENNPSENNITSKKEIKADGTIVETILEKKSDGTLVETVTEKNGQGHVVEKETTTKSDGSCTMKAIIEDTNTATSIKIEGSKTSDTDHFIANASIVERDVKKSKQIRKNLDNTTINEIKRVAGTNDVTINMCLMGSDNRIYLDLSLDAKDLVAGNKLEVSLYDKKKKRYELTELKPVVVSKEGTISIKLPALDSQISYVLLNTEKSNLVKRDSRYNNFKV